MKVGLAAQALPMRFSPMAVTRSSYLSAVASRADSFWLADHLNSLFPRSMAKPKYIGAARLTPKVAIE